MGLLTITSVHRCNVQCKRDLITGSALALHCFKAHSKINYAHVYNKCLFA